MGSGHGQDHGVIGRLHGPITDGVDRGLDDDCLAGVGGETESEPSAGLLSNRESGARFGSHRANGCAARLAFQIPVNEANACEFGLCGGKRSIDVVGFGEFVHELAGQAAGPDEIVPGQWPAVVVTDGKASGLIFKGGPGQLGTLGGWGRKIQGPKVGQPVQGFAEMMSRGKPRVGAAFQVQGKVDGTTAAHGGGIVEPEIIWTHNDVELVVFVTGGGSFAARCQADMLEDRAQQNFAGLADHLSDTHGRERGGDLLNLVAADKAQGQSPEGDDAHIQCGRFGHCNRSGVEGHIVEGRPRTGS